MTTPRLLSRALTVAFVSASVLALGTAASAAPDIELPTVRPKPRVRPKKKPKPQVRRANQVSNSTRMSLKANALQSALRKSNSAHDVRAYFAHAQDRDVCVVRIDDVTYDGRQGQIRALAPGRVKLESKPGSNGKRKARFACGTGSGPCDVWFIDEDGQRERATPNEVVFPGLSLMQASNAVSSFSSINNLCPDVIEETRAALDNPPSTPEGQYVGLITEIRSKFERRDELIFPAYGASNCEMMRQNTAGFATATFDLGAVSIGPNGAGDAVFFQCSGQAECIRGNGQTDDATMLITELTGQHGESISEKLQQLRDLHPNCG